MSKAALILVIFVATALLASQVSCQPISPTFRFAFCRTEEFGTYTANSTYGSNLQTVLSELEDHALIGMKFHNTSAGSGANTVHGQYYCRGDVTARFCSQCIQAASQKALNCSNAKAAIIWYSECTLRYKNQSMFGVGISQDNILLRSFSLNNLTDPDSLTLVLNDTVNGLIQEAVGSTPYFATGEKKLSTFVTAYFLVQCSPDLSEATCEFCLDIAFRAMQRSCCEDWPLFLYVFPASCQVMYDTRGRFYFPNNAPAPPPPSTLPSSSPPPTPSPVISSEPPPPSSPGTIIQTPNTVSPTRDNGSAMLRSSESVKLVIVAIALALLMLVSHT